MSLAFLNNPTLEYTPNNPAAGSPLELYLHVCQSGTEVLVDVGFKDRIKMLELDVSYQ